MSLDTVRHSDVPPGPMQFPKDYDRSLITQDIPLAQPTLGHPSAAAGIPLPWQYLEKPAPGEIPKASPKTHYPEVHHARPRDLSLTTHDIDFAVPAKIGRNSEGKLRADSEIDPLVPHYQFSSAEAQPLPTYRSSGKCTLDIGDIEGTGSAPVIPPRRQYGDTLKNEDEFRTPMVRGALTARAAKQDAVRANRPPAPGDGRRCCLTPTQGRRAGEQRQPLAERCDDPQAPRYRVPLPSQGVPGTSLHCRFSEERRAFGDAPPATEHQEVGHVSGSAPQSKIRHTNEPMLSLETRDIPGGRPLQRVGALPYTIYGPIGTRSVISQSLHAADIEGARADTLTRGPRSTVMKLQQEREQEQQAQRQEQQASRLAANGAAVLSGSGPPPASAALAEQAVGASAAWGSASAASETSHGRRQGSQLSAWSGTPRSGAGAATPRGHQQAEWQPQSSSGGAARHAGTADLLQSTLLSAEAGLHLRGGA